MTSLIKTDGRVLAALDPSTYADSVADHAGWAASRVGAPLVLLHTLDRDNVGSSKDLSGNLALGSREALLEQLATIDAERAKLAQEQGRALLAHAAEHVAERFGLQAETRLRHGALVDTLLDAEEEVRLFVVGKRGEHADFARGHLGSNLERVVRAVHRPVLVASRAFKPVQRFMIAFDGSATTRKCVEMVIASPLLKGLPGVLLAAGDSAPAGMDEAAGKLREAGFDIQAVVAPGNPDAVIAAQVTGHGIDLLVMGAYGHSKIRQLIVGSTTTQVLRSCTIPVLLLR
ncbi:universal stress protein [Marilutibacter alkalisoli]|uniref:Universal stress protein n=1 Tax=Marilutibacter alkalisoli TaxID=2591633 RepID=A0A514BQR0_9GAMM|nr:universal stress protein [Lysobacter alkalisoli]QDH69730.1 universal stress protein [Lysobacter alkalisoli]